MLYPLLPQSVSLDGHQCYSQRITFGFHWIFSIIFGFHFKDFCSDLCYSCSSAYFDFICSNISSFFRLKLRSLIWCFSCFLIEVPNSINFPISTALAVSHKFCYIVLSFSFSSVYFLILFWISVGFFFIDYIEKCYFVSKHL